MEQSVSCRELPHTFNAGCFIMISCNHSYSDKIKIKNQMSLCRPPWFNKSNKKNYPMTNSIPESKSLIWVIDIKSIDCIIVYIFEPVLRVPHLAFLLKWFQSVTYFLLKSDIQRSKANRIETGKIQTKYSVPFTVSSEWLGYTMEGFYVHLVADLKSERYTC